MNWKLFFFLDFLLFIRKILFLLCTFRFILVDIGEAGRHSDGGVLSNSLFGQALEQNTLLIPAPSPLPGCGLQIVSPHIALVF